MFHLLKCGILYYIVLILSDHYPLLLIGELVGGRLIGLPIYDTGAGVTGSGNARLSDKIMTLCN